MKLARHDPTCGQHFYWWECDCCDRNPEDDMTETKMQNPYDSLANGFIKSVIDGNRGKEVRRD